ncbi:DUF4352 domain-containing protein [Neobacillus novalis]|uniref:DUF4352 domain-containing protein n=1 Tax=Neobacillus novalis TaxID=220687 RepID=A0AA95SHH1_9BACI|nr:DUF4352 domain-containing protein [Neobacillus novalis]WHY86981.1 DUF4352 domain-containing protein [Neobacillus novalis]
MKKIGKIIMIVVGVIIVLGVIGSMLDGGEEKSDKTSKEAATTTTKTTSETKNKQTNETKQSEKPKVKAFVVGDIVKTGKLGYKVLNVETTKEIKSDNQFIESVKTEGQFVVIDLEAFNYDKKARMVDSNMFKIKDDQGREFEPTSDSNVMMVVKGAMDFFLQDINPGLSKKGKLVFELPQDAASYSLEVSSGFGWAGGEYEEINLK